MKTLTAKFQPSNSYTGDFIVEQIIPKLNKNLPAVANATHVELILAVGAFFANGLNSYIVDCSTNPLFEEIRDKLFNYGYLRPDDTVKNVYRMDLPNNRLEFRTFNSTADAPKVDTTYNTRYADGTHSEIDRKHITLIDGYPAITYLPINPELQVAYLTGKQDQPSKQYISLDGEKLSTTFLKADREELQATHDRIINAAVASTDNVWRYKDGLIGYHLPLIEKAMRNGIIAVTGKADFKFLALIEQNNYHGEIDTVESIGGTA